MPDMRRWYLPFGLLLSPALRAAHFPGRTWADDLVTAASLARLVADLHDGGYVIGDFKPDNLWADAVGNVGISDVDSFQFTDGAGSFRSLARTADYTAPERIRVPDALPGDSADDFVLAILIYQLLMQGLHPFFGLPADGSRYVSVDDNILHGRTRVVRPDSVRPVAGAPHLPVLPRQVRRLLTRCFGAGMRSPAQRPGAREWAIALDLEATAGRLRTCPADPEHVHTAELPWCPWCAPSGE
jgi:DNA-binding helix-hairpin-helix protein with protein kinase domain